MTKKTKVFSYFSKSNYEYLKETSKELDIAKSRLIEFGILKLRKMDKETLKKELSEVIL